MCHKIASALVYLQVVLKHFLHVHIVHISHQLTIDILTLVNWFLFIGQPWYLHWTAFQKRIALTLLWVSKDRNIFPSNKTPITTNLCLLLNPSFRILNFILLFRSNLLLWLYHMLTSINRTSVTKLLLPQNNNVWTTQHFRLIQLVLMLFILFMFVIKDGFDVGHYAGFHVGHFN